MLRFDLNLVFTIINLILLYLVMQKFLFGPVNAILAKRREAVAEEFAQADKSRKEAEALKKQYEESLQGAEGEKERIVSQARTDAQGEYERIVQEAQNKAQKLIGDAKGTANAERDKLLKEAETKIADIIVTGARKVLAKEHGKESDSALYEEFLGKAGDSVDRDDK